MTKETLAARTNSFRRRPCSLWKATGLARLDLPVAFMRLLLFILVLSLFRGVCCVHRLSGQFGHQHRPTLGLTVQTRLLSKSGDLSKRVDLVSLDRRPFIVVVE